MTQCAKIAGLLLFYSSFVLLSACGSGSSDSSTDDGTDETEALPTLSVAHARAIEGNPLEFVFNLNRASSQGINIAYQINGGSAVEGTHYKGVSGNLAITKNTRSTMLTVVTVDDVKDNPNRTLQLLIKSATLADGKAIKISNNTANGVIEDNDSPPQPQDPSEPQDPTDNTKPTAEKAARFLQQTTFGPTLTDIEKVQNMGFEAWIDEQMQLPIGKHLSYYDEYSVSGYVQHFNAWLHRSVKSPDQLRQRVAFALSEIWVVSRRGLVGDAGMRQISNYYDILLTHSFGNYRDLMEDVTLNPMMGKYLSMLRNQKPNPKKNIRPDENYAREFMQLFTIGLSELHLDGEPKLDNRGKPIPAYSQDDIEGLAHVFTGWTWANAPRFFWKQDNRDLLSPMKAFPEYHADGEKRIVNGGVIPAGQTPEQDLKQAIDHIFAHPNLGPFVSKQLIQKLVTSNPSRAYVKRVATVFNDNGRGVRGDLAAVVKAILLDKEALTGTTSADKTFGKVKEPLIKLTSVWRAFDAKMLNSNTYDFRSVEFRFAQAPLNAPSVFNFFQPDFAPQGDLKNNGLVAPEMQIYTEGTMSKMTNQLQWQVLSENNYKENPRAKSILVDITRERNMSSNPEALMDHLNLLLLAGKMSPQLRKITLDLVATHPGNKLEKKAADAISILITSPEFAVQH